MYVDTCTIRDMATLAGKITITEAAKRLAVSRQRMHQIIVESGLKIEAVHPRLFLIHPRELEKIRPKGRPGRKSKKESSSS
jgi:hypothetical protein